MDKVSDQFLQVDFQSRGKNNDKINVTPLFVVYIFIYLTTGLV